MKKDVEASVDGVLGGYGHVNEPDIKDSEAFLSLLLNERFPRPSSATTDQRHLVALGKLSLSLSTHTHTHTSVYMYMYVCVCVCLSSVTPFKISCCML